MSRRPLLSYTQRLTATGALMAHIVSNLPTSDPRELLDLLSIANRLRPQPTAEDRPSSSEMGELIADLTDALSRSAARRKE